MRQSKRVLAKFILNYRLVLTYSIALLYLLTHYFVTFTEFEDDGVDKQYVNFHNRKILEDRDNARAAASKTTILKLLSQQTVQKVYSSPKRNRIQIIPPSVWPSRPYQLKNQTTKYYSQIRQDQLLEILLDTEPLNKRNASWNGFFVEAGAYDGETWSNTLYLERQRKWTGLLIEPSVDNFKILKQKNRNAYLVNNCLCAGLNSVNTSYIEAGPFGITINSSLSSSSSSKSTPSVQCHPLAKILDEYDMRYGFKRSNLIDRKRPLNDDKIIDYLSLDIEGGEKLIVETFPWTKYKFNLINIEYNQDKKLYEWLRDFLSKRGYVETIVDDVWHQDLYMAHRDVYSMLNKKIKRVSELEQLLLNHV